MSNRVGIQALIETLGEPEFAGALLGLARGIAGADHLAVIRFDADLVPHVALAASLDGSQTARRAGERYCSSSLNLSDPLRGRMSRDQPYPNVTVGRLTLKDINDKPPWLSTYRALSMAERWSIVGNRAGDWIAINFYREISTQAPGNVQATLNENAALIHALVMRHLRWTTPPLLGNASFAAVLADLSPRLSPRQQQVCERALLGLSNPEIAHDLGIGTATVSTLRRRAYERLGISNLAELFGRCIAEQRGPR